MLPGRAWQRRGCGAPSRAAPPAGSEEHGGRRRTALDPANAIFGRGEAGSSCASEPVGGPSPRAYTNSPELETAALPASALRAALPGVRCLPGWRLRATVSVRTRTSWSPASPPCAARRAGLARDTSCGTFAEAMCHTMPGAFGTRPGFAQTRNGEAGAPPRPGLPPLPGPRRVPAPPFRPLGRALQRAVSETDGTICTKGARLHPRGAARSTGRAKRTDARRSPCRVSTRAFMSGCRTRSSHP